MAYWSVVYTNAQSEPIARREIEALGFGTFLPWYSTGKWQGDHLRVRYKPLVSRYVFVHLSEDVNWSEIAHTKGTNRLLLTNGEPARVQATQIADLMLAHCTGLYDVVEARRNKSGRFIKQRRRRRRPRRSKVVARVKA